MILHCHLTNMQTLKLYMGIDPGAKGGIALITERGGAIAFPYSTDKLIEICRWCEIRTTTVENVHAMPHQGVSSTFAFGRNLGVILGVLEAFEVPYTYAEPRTWKKHFGLNKDKQKSIDKCKELFPDVDLLPTSRSRKESDGMAEALLICLYGKEQDELNRI